MTSTSSNLYFKGARDAQEKAIAFEFYQDAHVILQHFHVDAQPKSFDQEVKAFDFYKIVLTSDGIVQFRTTPSKFVKTVKHIRDYIRYNRIMREAHERSPVVKAKLVGEPAVDRMLQLDQLASKAGCKQLSRGAYCAEWTI